MFAFLRLAAATVLVSSLCTLPLALSIPGSDSPLVLPSRRPPPSAGQCNTGTLQCCNSIQGPRTPGQSASSDGSLIAVIIQDLGVPIGLTCDPITVIGGGANSCSASPACCENVNGTMGINCTPVDISSL